ncbi:MAG TPA: LURP-one-related family protein [Tepidisphaeraceae bacterium]|jgi:uncharacterized protein YxjI|nr:LURP-one-related family protein [Tepidisphaeraceae bacterium]
MRYQLKQKLLSFGDDFVIRDEAGNEAYYVDGKVFTIRNTLSLKDAAGTERALIRQKLLSWGVTYEILRDGVVAAVVKKEMFTFLRYKFSVDVPGPNDLEAVGSFTDMEYVFSRGNNEVARVSKRYFALSDSYGVEVADGEDDVLILASAVVIDMVCHPDQKHHGA